ncbi:MAG: hypothetical protein MUC45_11880 [Actinomycetia bacterium]|jgi:hypothetical protein|nr:hypothetical protein [Actinomycetes bacterium]
MSTEVQGESTPPQERGVARARWIVVAALSPVIAWVGLLGSALLVIVATNSLDPAFSLGIADATLTAGMFTVAGALCGLLVALALRVRAWAPMLLGALTGPAVSKLLGGTADLLPTLITCTAVGAASVLGAWTGRSGPVERRHARVALAAVLSPTVAIVLAVLAPVVTNPLTPDLTTPATASALDALAGALAGVGTGLAVGAVGGLRRNGTLMVAGIAGLAGAVGGALKTPWPAVAPLAVAATASLSTWVLAMRGKAREGPSRGANVQEQGPSGGSRGGEVQGPGP